MTTPTDNERDRRDEVMRRILDYIQESRTIQLDAKLFSGGMGPWQYQFEGEEDLLHLIVTDRNEAPITVEQAREVAGFVLQGLPPALIWLRPGKYSQHFYFGHDELIDNLVLPLSGHRQV